MTKMKTQIKFMVDLKIFRIIILIQKFILFIFQSYVREKIEKHVDK
jgi:hypothetical protein